MNASKAIAASDGSAASLAAWKVALLLATGVSCHYSLTPPHRAAPKTVLEKQTMFERAIQWVTFCSKTMVWMMALTDSLATVLAAAKVSSSSPQTHDPLLRVSPMLVVGACAVICANLLRQWCFRELGRLFTFEVSIQSDHSLVTTGPYGLVRHPSYLGIYLTLLGPTLVGFAKGSWLREYLFRTPSSWWGLPGPGQALVFALVAFWFVKLCVVFKGTSKRLGIEDRALQKEFGGKWDEYARRVRWSMIPGVY